VGILAGTALLPKLPCSERMEPVARR
jgi:hypothetical protein